MHGFWCLYVNCRTDIARWYHLLLKFPLTSQSSSPLHGIVLRLQRSNPLLRAAGDSRSGFQLRYARGGVRQAHTQLLLGRCRYRLRFLGACAIFVRHQGHVIGCMRDEKGRVKNGWQPVGFACGRIAASLRLLALLTR